MLVLSACSSTEPARRDPALADLPAAPVRYSIICFIHGDGDYLYHDSTGIPHRADENALLGMLSVAEKNPFAEVFIFHELPESRFLLLFPRHDDEFFYYRNGRLLARESYARVGGAERYETPARLYREYHTHAPAVNMFLYFGHELPESADEEAPLDQPSSVPGLAAGLHRFAGDFTTFDLVVLSSCFNGTPSTVAALSPYARTIVASPDNLHLSYFDLRAFERLEVGIPNGDVPAFARHFARQSFERLTEEIQTAVTVAVYDVECVQGYLHSVDSVQRVLRSEHTVRPVGLEHCDCADVPSYASPGMSDGVEVFFRPARFGRSKGTLHHSGWQCWKETELQVSRAAE